MDPTTHPSPTPASTPAHTPGQSAHPEVSPHGHAAPAATPAPAESVVTQAHAQEIDEAMAAMGFGERTGSHPKGGSGAAGQGGGHAGGHGQKRDHRKPMTTLPGHDVAPIGGPAKAALKGPRVVSAGREHRSGLVVSVGPSDIFLEFGPKELGVAPRTQWPEDQLPVAGTQLEVIIDRFEASESLFICSRPGSVVKAAWENLEIGQTVEGKVVAVNKGGLEVEIAGHRAFMPASQVSLDRIPDLSVMIGEKLTCQVSQLDKRGKGNIILSRRDLLAQERQQRAAKLKDTLEVGATLDGTVRKIMAFGAFVDIGGIDGLVHISDLTYDRTGFGEQAVAKHLKEGQSVKVKVMKIEWDDNDIKKSRISLGVKQLAADPFQTAVADIKEGVELSGRVTRLAEFGAFVELAPGVEGLVHVSEIAHRRINLPADVLKTDEVVQCKVLKLDAATRRISLSIKAMLAPPEPQAAPGGGQGGGPGGPGRGGQGGPGGPGRGGPGGGGGGRGGMMGRGAKDMPMRSVEEITKDSPALRRLRAQAAMKAQQKGGTLKGGF